MTELYTLTDSDVVIGETYLAHVSGQLQEVRVVERIEWSGYRGWLCVRVSTGNKLTRPRTTLELRRKPETKRGQR